MAVSPGAALFFAFVGLELGLGLLELRCANLLGLVLRARPRGRVCGRDDEPSAAGVCDRETHVSSSTSDGRASETQQVVTGKAGEISLSE